MMGGRGETIRVAALLACAAVLAGCGAVPKWREFHAQGPNDGAVFLATEMAWFPKWQVSVGPVAVTQPVVGKNGSIYVGTQAGALIAVDSGGTKTWTAVPVFGHTILSSPAVDREGSIYVVTASPASADSFMHKYNDAGTLLWSRSLPGKVSSSPKTRGIDDRLLIYILVPGAGPMSEIWVLDRDGTTLHVEPVCGSIVQGGSPFTKPNPDFVPIPYPDPTLAVDDRERRGESGEVIVDRFVIAAHRHCIHGYKANGAALQEIWTHDFTDRDRQFFSPVIPAGTGSVIVGGDDGHVRSHDIETGNVDWDFDAGDTIVGTPADIALGLYVASQHNLFVIQDGTGSVLWQAPLIGETFASPAASAKYVYVPTSDALFTADLGGGWQNASFVGKSRDSSPAIGADGTVYVVNSAGMLLAYPGTGR